MSDSIKKLQKIAQSDDIAALREQLSVLGIENRIEFLKNLSLDDKAAINLNYNMMNDRHISAIPGYAINSSSDTRLDDLLAACEVPHYNVYDLLVMRRKQGGMKMLDMVAKYIGLNIINNILVEECGYQRLDYLAARTSNIDRIIYDVQFEFGQKFTGDMHDICLMHYAIMVGDLRMVEILAKNGHDLNKEVGDNTYDELASRHQNDFHKNFTAMRNAFTLDIQTTSNKRKVGL